MVFWMKRWQHWPIPEIDMDPKFWSHQKFSYLNGRIEKKKAFRRVSLIDSTCTRPLLLLVVVIVLYIPSGIAMVCSCCFENGHYSHPAHVRIFLFFISRAFFFLVCTYMWWAFKDIFPSMTLSKTWFIPFFFSPLISYSNFFFFSLRATFKKQKKTKNKFIDSNNPDGFLSPFIFSFLVFI